MPFSVWTDWLWFLSFKPQRETILFLFNLPSFICCLCYFLFVFFRVVNDLLTEQMNKFHSLSHGAAFGNRPGAVICGYFLCHCSKIVWQTLWRSSLMLKSWSIFTGVSLECYSLFTLDSLSAASRSHHVGTFIWSGSAGWLVSQHFFEWLSQTQIFAYL